MWNLPGPSRTQDCIDTEFTSRTPRPSSVKANTELTHAEEKQQNA